MCSAVDTPAGRPGPRSRLCERLLELDHTAEHTSSGPGRMPAAPRRHGRLRLVELELAADGGCGSGRGWGEGAVGSSRQRPREQWSWEAHRGRGRPIAWRAHTETRGERITRRRPTISIGLGGGWRSRRRVPLCQMPLCQMPLCRMRLGRPCRLEVKDGRGGWVEAPRLPRRDARALG